jgi:tetraacyldisaccharide 4'-kinase
MTAAWIQRAWRREGLLGRLLWVLLVPASLIFYALVRLRNAWFSRSGPHTLTLGRPAISIGNLTVGGTGKTPTCIWLARALKERGLKTAILTRGYGGKRSAPWVFQGSTNGGRALASSEEIASAGDEPCMMAKLYGETVAVCKDRLLAAQEILRQGDIDVFILDDGFQYRRVRRDADVVLLGNDASGWILPAGPFREPPTSLARADFLLLTGAEKEWSESTHAWRDKLTFRATLTPVSLIGYQEGQWKEYRLSLLHHNKIIAVAGIAHAERFYRVLHDLESDVLDVLEFPDHHHYSAADWQRINRVGRSADLIVTTEKDIIKLARFPFARNKLLALRVEMVVENGESLIAALSRRVRAPRAEAEAI